MANKSYESSKIAIDPVILTIHNGKLKILLHTREKEPFKELKELPGGLLLPNETAKDTLKRKLNELVGLKNVYLKQFFTFTNPNRDPRHRVISIGFISLINAEKISEFTNWYDCNALKSLAFDHKEIIHSAKIYLKENLNSSIVKEFMPKSFPLNKLQEVYELIENVEYDNRNFRKKMIKSGIVEVTEKYETNVSHRPAKLFKFK